MIEEMKNAETSRRQKELKIEFINDWNDAFIFQFYGNKGIEESLKGFY